MVSASVIPFMVRISLGRHADRVGPRRSARRRPLSRSFGLQMDEALAQGSFSVQAVTDPLHKPGQPAGPAPPPAPRVDVGLLSARQEMRDQPDDV
jgi:hypothetical protein